MPVIRVERDGEFIKFLTDIKYGESDRDGNVFMKGCFDKALAEQHIPRIRPHKVVNAVKVYSSLRFKGL